jgi:hypothetical protein
MESVHAELCIDGKLSRAKLVERNPALDEVFERGMWWDVWDAAAEEMYPLLPDVAQRALNAKHVAQQDESNFQVLLRVVSSSERLVKNGRCPWDIVSKDVLKSQPKFAEDAPSIIEFAQKWSGLKKGLFTEPMLDFVRSYMPSSRIVPGRTFKQLASLKLSAADLCPRFIHSVLYLQAWCPQEAVVAKVASFVTKADIASLTKAKRLADMKTAEAHLNKFEGYLKLMPIPLKSQSELRSKVYPHIAAHVLKKTFLLEFESMDDIFHEAFAAAQKMFESDAKLPKGLPSKNPWKKTEATSDDENEETTQTVARNAVRFNSEGSAFGVLQMSMEARGYVVGNNVKCTADGQWERA